MDRRRIVARGGVKRSKYIVPCFLFVEVSCTLDYTVACSLLSPSFHRLPYLPFSFGHECYALPSSGTKRNLKLESLQRDFMHPLGSSCSAFHLRFYLVFVAYEIP